MAFKDDISMQEYYGSFPTTSKATAVSRRTGVRKISVTPNLNAIGPSGDERAEEAMDRIPSPANPNRGPANIGPSTGGGTAMGNTGSGAPQVADTPSGTGQSGFKTPMWMKGKTPFILGGAALLLALLAYRKFKK